MADYTILSADFAGFLAYLSGIETWPSPPGQRGTLLFLAYLSGIETEQGWSGRNPRYQFLAYLSGIETNSGASSPYSL